MTTLHDAFRERRGIASRAFIRRSDTGEPVHLLAILGWDKRSWHFPWSCLTRVECDRSAVPEVLRLFFVGQAVVVEGRRLALLLPEISAMRLESISEMPPGAAEMVGSDSPVIEHVYVSMVTGSPTFS